VFGFLIYFWTPDTSTEFRPIKFAQNPKPHQFKPFEFFDHTGARRTAAAIQVLGGGQCARIAVSVYGGADEFVVDRNIGKAHLPRPSDP